MSWIKDKITKLVINNVVSKLIGWLQGKKTVIGALSLVLWVMIYAVPVVFPQLGVIADAAKSVKDALEAGGINLDAELFSTGVGFTVVGLFDKFIKLFGKNKK